MVFDVEKMNADIDCDIEQRVQSIRDDWAKNPEHKEEFLLKIQLQNEEVEHQGAILNAADDEVFFECSLIDFEDVKDPLLAHVMAKAGIFPSVSQARKNGWDQPLVAGEWIVTKKKKKIRVL